MSREYYTKNLSDVNHNSRPSRRAPRKTFAQRNNAAGARNCSCPGCNNHLTRLEELNAQLAAECDRLRRLLAEPKKEVA